MTDLKLLSISLCLAISVAKIHLQKKIFFLPILNKHQSPNNAIGDPQFFWSSNAGIYLYMYMCLNYIMNMLLLCKISQMLTTIISSQNTLIKNNLHDRFLKNVRTKNNIFDCLLRNYPDNKN